MLEAALSKNLLIIKIKVSCEFISIYFGGCGEGLLKRVSGGRKGVKVA